MDKVDLNTINMRMSIKKTSNYSFTDSCIQGNQQTSAFTYKTQKPRQFLFYKLFYTLRPYQR